MSELIGGRGRQGLPKRVYKTAYASFRVFGPTLDPLTVTLALRLPADYSHRNGEPRLVRTKKGKVLEHAPYHHGMWSVSSEKWVNSPRLAVHLEWLLGQLGPRADALAGLRADGIVMDFFCYSAGDTRLPPSLPRSIRTRAEALQIAIEIDHYCSHAGPDADPTAASSNGA